MQEVAYSLLSAAETVNEENGNDVFERLVDKLTDYFSPKHNTAFERRIIRGIKKEGEGFNKFMLKIKQQAKRCWPHRSRSYRD